MNFKVLKTNSENKEVLEGFKDFDQVKIFCDSANRFMGMLDEKTQYFPLNKTDDKYDQKRNN